MSGGDDRDPFKAAVKSSSAAILARILVMNTNYLAQLTSEPSLSLLLQNAGISIEDSILLGLVDIWLEVSRMCTSKTSCPFMFSCIINVFNILCALALEHKPLHSC